MNDGASTDGIAGRIEVVRRQIISACRRAGRDPADVTLIAVSKTFSWEVVSEAYAAGIRDFGENYMQDALGKIEQSTACKDIRWHFIGHLQRNKVRYWNPGFTLFHCLDSLALAKELQKKAAREDMTISTLVQVKLGDEPTKSGLVPEAVEAFIRQLADLSQLRLEGLMTIPPYMIDPEESRCYYRQLRDLRERIAAGGSVDPRVFRHLSMGMSHDYPVAVEEGATYVRVGTAIFGSRQPQPQQ